ncbi:Hypothetical predicted protein [Cloeon dipterum]|uniref:Uncharacterized protein n=1 Tax=Cloeon dipterum TaxID=197152 RepID=A0A8S1DZ52_9INSE|nr:Hypothetical predicted protein [Cloeon dipterum]
MACDGMLVNASDAVCSPARKELSESGLWQVYPTNEEKSNNNITPPWIVTTDEYNNSKCGWVQYAGKTFSGQLYKIQNAPSS